MFVNDEAIVVRGAKTHNLKNVHAVIPRDRFTVITGPSGSGKSSLAFDTIYAEGQRRYVESLSAYARQFLEQMSKPEVDSISGLSPTIAIEQKTTSFNPRSTVGTVTEIYDHLRLIYARLATPYCWKCGEAVQSQSPSQMAEWIVAKPEGARFAILAPIARSRKGEYQKEFHQLRTRGFSRVQVDGKVLDLSEEIKLDKNKKHDIFVYIDRLIQKGNREVLLDRVRQAIEIALDLGEGTLIVESQDSKGRAIQSVMSLQFACPNCHLSYPEPEPRTFSFNSPMGACPHCDGLGMDPIEHKKRVAEEAQALEDDQEVSVDASALTPDRIPCPQCKGTRLRKESLHFKLGDKNIAELCKLPISTDLIPFLQELKLTDRQKKLGQRLMREIRERLQFLDQVGAGYLSLDRSSQTLSGGEAQRIRLATQIGSSLVGVIYVLDEPSIGLHQKDNQKLIQTLKHLRDMGNTVLVVEHDRDTIEQADWILDMGPGAGRLGGELTVAGQLKDVLKSKKSLTGRYLRGELEIPVPKIRRPSDSKREIRIKGANQNNLKNVNVSFPLGLLTCVTGVSGSGKSTLVIDTLYRAALQSLYTVRNKDLKIKSIEGLDQIDKVIDIDQQPIGRTPRSNPATYTGLFSGIRDLFAHLPESQMRGYGPGRYSFNVKGGRCEACQGDGTIKVEMHFLPPVFVQCDTCHGRRYHQDTLEVKYKGKNIADVLEMTGEEALPFFDAIPSLKSKLKTIVDVGLGYLHLGQSSTTLSGGEAQRIKLAKELSKRSTGKTLYILDEPSTGLHFDDVKKLISILQTLTDQGNTVVVIEHNLDIIKVADHLIDVGPVGGEGGGKIIASGTPEEVSKKALSDTGQFLKPYLKRM